MGAFGDDDFIVGCIAQDDGVGGGAELHACERIAGCGVDDERGVAVLHVLAGLKNVFDEEVDLGTGSDGGEIGADVSAGACDGVTAHAA